MLIEVSDGVYDVFLTTRDPNTVCTSQTYSQVLGDRLLLNSFFPVPLNMSGAEQAGWVSHFKTIDERSGLTRSLSLSLFQVMGNCIGRMGIHHAYDLASPGNQTWNWQTQVPILPMYDAVRHSINAILFNGELIWKPSSHTSTNKPT